VGSAATSNWVLAQLGVSGILVLDARKGGPAWKSGIKGTSRDEFGRLVIGDVITAFRGMPIKYGPFDTHWFFWGIWTSKQR